jgi:hypothetical protein
MHTNRISPARKIIVWLAALAGLALLAGCETVTLTNLTPASMPENPSQIYTFSLRVTPRTRNVQLATVEPHIVVDGKNFPMTKSPLGDGIYDFEYQLASGRDQVAYYYLVNYGVESNGTVANQQAYTDIATAKVVRRYVLSLEVNRGPVGSRIGILGRGFTERDQVSFNGQPVRTEFQSSTSLSFFVPPLDPNHNYQVTLSSPAGNSPIGTFRIDPSTVTVFPTALTLRTKQSQTLTFTIPNPAPAGGTLLDISTDVPDSVIMPEVVVPQGSNTVSVQVEGGRPGSGNLFLKGYGNGEVSIPVTVSP